MKESGMLPICLCAMLVIGSLGISKTAAQNVSSFTKESDGVLCQLSNSTKLKLQVCAGNIIRVVYTSQESIPSPQGMIVARSTFSPGTWDATDNGTAIVVTTPKVTATVAKTGGLVTFASASGTAVCSESGRALTAATKGGVAGFSGTLNFNSPADEAVYGLGNLSLASPGWSGDPSYWAALPPDINGVLNIRGLNVDMRQSNWYDVIPFFMTTSGYGVLMNFACHATKTAPLNFTADFLLNNSWDYYFIYGPQFDTIISGYRYITGPAPMLSKWAFGFWQCKNRYTSAAEVTTAVSTYRTRNIPLDCIVQDWMWWTGGGAGRGSFSWDATNFPNPSAMLSTIHDSNCHFAVSIWPTFSSSCSNYTAMQPYLLNTITCNRENNSTEIPGIFLNPFDTTGIRKFWDLMKTSCFDIGVDAWWMDATEPECPLLTGVNTTMGMIDLYSNAYAIAHAKSIYERQRAASSAKRVVNLTRSFYAGQQRFGTIYWNGDISSSSIANVKTTVAGGINSCMAGNPYWCSDIGGFQANGGSLTDEILTRWFQAGTFFPIFRVHGSRNTEIYNMAAQPQQICTDFSRLRYRLMPYIYSLAWKVTSENYTMTRALPFDFPDDATVKNIADEFMLGPALLVNPVSTAGATSRSVYLPAGTWYDFWTGTPNTGAAGRIVTASAPIQIIPVYARAGAILPMGPRIQYATQSVDPIELRVYPGADGSFNLYEDEGDGYGYENNQYSIIPISFSNSTGRVTIGPRTGSFTGMLAGRTFNVVFVSGGKGIGDTVTANPDCVISYTGAEVSGCPVSLNCPDCAARNRLGSTPQTIKTALDRVSFPGNYAGAVKEIAVYDVTGRLLRVSLCKKHTVSLRRDFGLPEGTYIIRVKITK
jgi:alpha-D-xyloside xylohydrolase